MVFALIIGTFGCNESTETPEEIPKVEDYNQACQVNSDCELVNENACGCGTCSQALNKGDLAAYTAAAARTCSDLPGDCSTCLNEPACVQGKCQAREPRYISAEEFLTTCQTASDCLLIQEGDLCQPCPCPSIPVNAADYASKVSSPECGYSGVVCNNCPQPPVDCVDNICIVVDEE